MSYTVSVPQIPSGVDDAKVDDEALLLELPALRLVVVIQNHRRGADPLRPLALWLGLDASQPGVTLDPGSVTLETDDGRVHSPVTFLGPARPWQSGRAATRGCGERRRYSMGVATSRTAVSAEDLIKGNPEAGVLVPAGPVAIEGNVCVVLHFDVDPSPDQPLVVSVAGLRRKPTVSDPHGAAIAVPAVAFAKGRVKKYFPVP